MRPYTPAADDTMRPRADRESGEMVNRKPVVFSFLVNRPRKHRGAEAASNRMGKKFIEKLKGLGL